MRASDIAENPRNWRVHPEGQVSAMQATLDKIGFAGALIARDVGGKVELLDGHLRRKMAGNDLVPVLIVDLNDQEAAHLLATYDPLSDLATVNEHALARLLEEAGGDDDAFMRSLLSQVTDEVAREEAKGELEHDVPGMALDQHEHYDYLVVMAATSHEWNVLCDRLGLVPEKRRKRIGTARAIRAARLLTVLNERA